ncbi:c-type cytochrome [Flavobacteriaceae bacterium F89]|uniref:C-type cytochrome n=1 Tax=Cerina litoralis TaxID=2874477 RepID=A0AAE3EWL3_9FLAO|nr:c-type cytochrome [Cerina litoralis]MCG2461047.1 c-type cytochrome [Cerina litoralis]
MRLILFFIGFLMACSCKTEKKSINIDEEAVPQRSELSVESQLMLGNRLFSEKTCTTCHAVSSKKVGPSVKEIMHVYREQKGDIVAFLKGEAEPIVDTISAQVDIMQENIDGFLQGVSDEDLKIIANYMLHIDEISMD